MSENDYKKTYNGFTKLVLWGTIAIIAILVILAVILL
ncbi:MAG: aa3-type cytochrome c oxidase subunit IV [Coraliomargarita sp. TMED73]|nr:MAG: aa3-type cytochrome c oxidase subunit IV [Coraliomargarita sp. TMED73]